MEQHARAPSIVTPSRRQLPRKTVLFIEHLLVTVGGGGGNGVPRT
jgi:hypothetical protein